jgi:hypothetical protein
MLGTAAVLLAGLLTLLLINAFGSSRQAVAPQPAPPGAGPVEAGPGSLIPGLPEAKASDPRDADPPTFLDGADTAWRGAVERDVHLLVFADTESSAGRSTIRTSNALHRRLRDTSVVPVLVLPRKAFERSDGTLLLEEERATRLKALEADADVTVLLDPATRAVRERYSVTDPIAAVVLVDGDLVTRTAPLEGGFTLFNIAKLVARALEIRPR